MDGPKIASIQHLRGLAALAVVLCHASNQCASHAFDLSWGIAGIDVFFVISGLIMVVAARAHNGFAFIGHRLIRVAPLYWLCTTLVVVSAALHPTLISQSQDYISYVIKSYAFIPFVMTLVENRAGPLVQQGWTLSFEMGFYILFALTFTLPIRQRIGTITALFLALTACGFWYMPDAQHAVLRTVTSPFLLEFVLGMWIGEALRSHHMLPVPLAWMGVLASSAFLIGGFIPGIRETKYIVPAAVFVFSVLSLDKAKRWPRLVGLTMLGDASYALYLTHGFAMAIIAPWTRPIATRADVWSGITAITLMTVASVALGLLVYHVLERPMQHKMRLVFDRLTRG
jgi:peptidoglycan/LPS O-acetylase OafA/YrhL